MAANLGAWEAAVAARDAELVALQSALGELAYESDAAERLRAELRGAQGRAEDLRRCGSTVTLYCCSIDAKALLTATAGQNHQPDTNCSGPEWQTVCLDVVWL